MAMHTFDLIPSEGWKVISDGTISMNCLVDIGAIEIWEATDALPTLNDVGQGRNDFTITPPTKIHARAVGGPARIIGISW